ncbi:MAG: hypothetical protein E6H00_10600 [Bacillati bacterium ANGP1]|uniref:Alginate export domain-containing protein n=1 Tax=Candidatus Segetimicrobium genomatis TaxID=2569760 RepID=A0A537K082_9BACT|nr:MAG: hypothetical protein E6H00_10600 [Terrabacteria group bacterium ANGP1]
MQRYKSPGGRWVPRGAVAVLALALSALARAPEPALAAGEAFAREVAKCEQGIGSVPLQVSGALTYTSTNAAVAAPADSNYTGPTPAMPRTTEPGLELCFTLTPGPGAALFADVSAKAPSDVPSAIGIDRLYLDLPNTLGVQDLRFRIGRDRVTLGPSGLLLNEVDIEGQRDGFQTWLPSIGPVRLSGFFQYALDDDSTTRRVWGGRAESQVSPGLTLGVNYRADIAAAADVGSCPGIDCATGSGYSLDLDGTIGPGLALTLSYGSYTQTGDVVREYYNAEAAFDFKALAGAPLHPVLTVWYKNLTPYTIPGSDGTVPQGGFLTPDDFKLFNVNDNLEAFGGSLELHLADNVALFALGEWGAYKSGPPYSVTSAGLDFMYPDSNIEVKLTYNAYTVAGGSVVTSPVSGLALSNATVYQIELTKSW